MVVALNNGPRLAISYHPGAASRRPRQPRSEGLRSYLSTAAAWVLTSGV